MPTYSFRCAACGPFDVVVPMAAVTAARACPACDASADRVFTAPGVVRTTPAHRGAVAAAERSRHEPEVTTTPPPRSRPAPVTRDPRHATLPRP